MSALAIRKNKLISELALIESEGVIAKIEEIIARETHFDERLSNVNRGIRKGVTIAQMKEEQNYQGTSFERIQAIANELDIQEPVEELIAMI